MGLLDLTSDQSDSLLDFGTGLLSAGGPSRMPVSLGQAFGQGMGAMRQGDQQRTHSRLQSGQLQMQQLQMDEIKRQLAMKEAMGRALQSGFLSGTAPAAGGGQTSPAFGLTPPSDGYSPALGAAPAQSSMADQLMLAARKAGDYGAYQDAVKMNIEEKKLAPKFSTDFRVGMDADGKPANFVLGDDGSWKQLPMGVAEKLHFANTVGATVGVNQYTGATVATLRNSQSPDSIASNSLARERFNFDKQQADQPTYSHIEGGDGLLAFDPKTGKAMPVINSQNGQPVPGGKGLTESQGKATAFSIRAREAADIIDSVGKDGAVQPGYLKRGLEAIPFAGAGLGTLANGTQGPKQQQVEQAQRDFVTAVLRLESGAAISDSEFSTARQQYFPQPGDSGAVIAQKKASRESEIKGLSIMAGPGAKNVSQPKQSAVSPGGWSATIVK